MTTIWLAILSTVVAMTLAAILLHHLWEARRDGRNLERLDALMKALSDQRALTLSAIKHRNGIEEQIADHGRRIALLERWRAANEGDNR